MKKRILCLMLLIILLVAMQSGTYVHAREEYISGIYKYFYANGTSSDASKSGIIVSEILEEQSGEFVLPTEINGEPILGFQGDDVFKNCDNVTKLIIPDGIKLFGDWASPNYWISLPKNCEYLKLGKDVKYFCTDEGVYKNLKQIEVSEQNKTFISIDDALCRRTEYTKYWERLKGFYIMVRYPLGKKHTFYKIPEKVIEIQETAFGGIREVNTLKGIMLPKTSFVTELGDHKQLVLRDEELATAIVKGKIQLFSPFSKEGTHLSVGSGAIFVVDDEGNDIWSIIKYNSSDIDAYALDVSQSEGYAPRYDGDEEATIFKFTAITSKDVTKISLSGDKLLGEQHEISYEYLKDNYGLTFEDGDQERVWTCYLPLYNAGERTITLNVGVDGYLPDASGVSVNVMVVEREEQIFSPTPQQGVFSPPPQIGVNFNGEELSFDVPPQIINDRTMVPLRVIFEALDATVEWDEKTSCVRAFNDRYWVEIIIGKDTMRRADVGIVDEDVIKLDSPAIIIDGRTLIPARAVAEAFNCKVNWDASTRTVSITN